jgi:predicted MPP superfamily phosphohydrolase
VVDSINAQKADMIAFTGDIQNKNPSEIEPFMPLLITLKATDGVFSVMGNHDYALYQKLDPYLAARNEETTISHQMDMKWQMLNNTHRIVRRDSDLVVIAGMENDGEGRFPQKGNINYALWGIDRQQFVIMLEHDPSSWRRKILRKSHAQLTLSGHTHAGQLSLFGWSPVSVAYSEYDGLYQQGQRCLFVSRGLGGVVPFRLGAPGEIVVITLRSKSKKE